MDDAEDDLHPQLRRYEGLPAAEARTGPDPVNTPMIRHWCEAMGHPLPADGRAPEAMLQVWTMNGLSDPDGPDGPAGPAGRSPAYAELLALLDGAGCTAVVATDCEQEYLRPLTPGQRITYDAVIESVSPRKRTRLGTGYFVTTRTEIRADGALAGTHRFRILKYAPGQREPDDRRPRPVVGRDNAAFWAGVAERRLLFQRCTDCAAPRFPWLPGCPDCGSAAWQPAEADGDGTVFSYVVVHHPPYAAFDTPYAVGLVELTEGVRIVSNITGVPPDKVRIGMPVRLEFLEADDELVLPVFRAEEG